MICLFTGLRPLHYAAWQGHTKPAEALLCQGSSVDKPAVDGNTPLHLACEHGHFDVVSSQVLYQLITALKEKSCVCVYVYILDVVHP